MGRLLKKMVSLLLGDCLEKMKEMESNSVDSIVTDPPYGISFMGKKWDYDIPSTLIQYKNWMWIETTLATQHVELWCIFI